MLQTQPSDAAGASPFIEGALDAIADHVVVLDPS